ncbi:hypothetical protein CQA66_08815 [Helicobacter aurati]|uniref:Uncharacterized protein n=1 Tax=Helicobacter aurati TaxID=137778 RepID=A0A3D8IWW4_9HELI|nr:MULTISPECIES: hypothetical protein [Helicobacter]RDU69777.1 hypothetical protein CQA66_08815 [Helicobacter aurati]
MTLVIENASKELQKAIKSMAKLDNAKVKVKKEKECLMKQALKEIKNGEYEVCQDFEEYKKTMES